MLGDNLLIVSDQNNSSEETKNNSLLSWRHVELYCAGIKYIFDIWWNFFYIFPGIFVDIKYFNKLNIQFN